jgi:hypothetical protein
MEDGRRVRESGIRHGCSATNFAIRTHVAKALASASRVVEQPGYVNVFVDKDATSCYAGGIMI